MANKTQSGRLTQVRAPVKYVEGEYLSVGQVLFGMIFGAIFSIFINLITKPKEEV